jgi:peptidyl-prolyl cis-trans isomerase SurA
MKKSLLIPALALTVWTPVFSHAAGANVADGIQAVVDTEAVTFTEVEDFSRPATAALRRQFLGQPDVYQEKWKAAIEDSLEQLIERQLIMHSFNTEGYLLPDSMVDQLVQERIRERFGDRITLMKTLQAQGMTFEQFRKQVREQYIESALRNQNVAREIIISPQKVQKYYQSHLDDYKVEDQVKLRMIVLTKSSTADTNTLQLAQEVADRIKAGASFVEMAATYSQGSQQHQGGDWGWVESSVLRKELSVVAASLAIGQVSAPIDTPDTVYIMLVEDKKAAHAKPLSEVRTDVEKTLRTQLETRQKKKWMDGLKKKTFIRYF